MDDLIERLEKATGPDRELFEATFFVCFGKVPKGDSDAMARWLWFSRLLDASAWIDAALMLVPEGWQWQISNRAPKPHTGRAYLNNRELINVGAGGMTPNPKYRGAEDTAATPAIAICIAALKARQTTLPPHERQT